MSELTTASLSTIVELIRTREGSSVEVAEMCLDRSSRLNPALNAIVTLAPDVMDRATAAEAAVMRGEQLGSLHGVPITIKDTIETAGLRSTSGSVIRKDYIPAVDAPAVARL